MRPLLGVRVVELSDSIAAALCTKLLADAGASVTRIERKPDGSEASWQRFLGLDKDVAEDASLERLLLEADLFVTTELHDAATAGLDCATLLARHPQLIALCLTPFGQDGPYARYAGSDAVLSALCGLADATPGFPDHTDGPDDPPVQSLAPLAQAAAAVTAANAALAALLARNGGGRFSRHVEVSALEAAVSMMTYEWGVTSYGGEVRGRRPGPADLEPNCYLPCRDGTAVLVAFGEAQWSALVEMMGDPPWAADPRFGTGELRTEHWRELRSHLAEWAADKEGSAILTAAQGRGVPCAPNFELRETLASEHIRATHALRDTTDGPVPADPAVVDAIRRPPPRPHGARPPRVAWRTAAAPLRPLEGVRVLDLTQYVAGPFAGQCLAALGAEVILVETSTHAPSRGFGPFAGTPAHDAGSTFNHHNRGKRSVLVNLKTEEGRRVLRELVRVSDVVLENFSRRAAEKLGVTYAELARERPDVILGSISGFGRSGPWGSYVALHSGVILLSGLASVTRDDEGKPRLVGSTYPDPLTGAYLALLVQQALAARAQTGAGCHLELSMLDVALTCMGGLVTRAARGEDLGRHQVRFLRSSEPGRYLAVEGDGDYSAQTRKEAMASLQARGVRAGGVLDMGEVIDDEHLRARGFVVRDGHPVARDRWMPGVPWLFDGVRPVLGPAPTLGEGTREVLRELVLLDDAQLDRYEQDGVLV